MALFEVRADERRATTLAFLALLGITASHTLIETSRDALFLAKVPVTHLPALYLAIAACGLATTRAGAALEARRKGNPPRIDPVATSLVVAAIITTAFWLGAASPTRPLLYGLYVYSGLFASWVAGQLWLRIGAIFTVSQAKRLFGLIGTGAVLGAVVGAAIARASLAAIEVRHLLIVGSGLLVVTAIGPVSMLPRPSEAPEKRRDHARIDPPAVTGLGAQIAAAARDPYVVRVLGIVLLTTAVGTAIDFVFKSQIALNVPKAEMGAFLATVSLVTNLASLVAQSLGVAVVMRALGVHRALYVTPLLLAIGAAGLVAGGPNVLFVFYAAIAIRGIDGTLRYSLQKTCAELLFVPLPDDVRKRAKPIVDLLGQRGGQAVASLGILALATFIPWAIPFAIVILTLLWLLVARSVRPRYLEVFRSTLRRGRMDFSAQLPDLDMTALEALIAALSSRKDAEVLGALDFLHAQSRGRLVPSLILYHPSKTIVLRALELLVLEGRADFVPVADRLLEHADPEVRAAALRARAAVEPDAVFLRGLLEDPQAEIRATALVALVANEGLAGEEAKTTLEGLAKEALPVRRALARAIGEIHAAPQGDARAILEGTIVALGEDDDTETRALAATAMGRFGTRFLPELIAMLEHRGIRASAGLAISDLGDIALDALDRALDDASVAAEAKWRIVAALGRSASKNALARLERRLVATTDTAIRTRILRALRSAQRAGVVLALEKKRLVDLAEQTIASGARALSFRVAHAKMLADIAEYRTPGSEIVQKLLKDKEIEAIDRLFSILALMSPEERFARIQRGLASANPKARASSRELLENVVRPPLREPVLAIVDDIDDEARLAKIGHPRNEADYSALLGAMVEQGGELGALAAFHANELGLRDSLRDVVARMGSQPPEGVFGEELSKRDLAQPRSSKTEVGAPA